MTKPMTPRVLRINPLETRVRPPCRYRRLARGRVVNGCACAASNAAPTPDCILLSLDHEPFPADPDRFTLAEYSWNARTTSPRWVRGLSSWKSRHCSPTSRRSGKCEVA